MGTETAPILITGCGRSGASMIAGVFNICGAFGGGMGKDDTYFENVRVRENVVMPYLRSIAADPFGQYPLPNTGSLPIPANWSNQVMNQMRMDGYNGGLWMYKESCISLIWPVWHYAFPNAKWIIVRRRTGDIIHSCMKTEFMRAFGNVENQQAVKVTSEFNGWLWWVHQHEQRFIEMITEGLNCRVIWPARFERGDYQQMYEAIEWLGLRWKSKALTFIDPKLIKSRQNGGRDHQENSALIGD
jgi:hypothetical protein